MDALQTAECATCIVAEMVEAILMPDLPTMIGLDRRAAAAWLDSFGGCRAPIRFYEGDTIEREEKEKKTQIETA